MDRGKMHDRAAQAERQRLKTLHALCFDGSFFKMQLALRLEVFSFGQIESRMLHARRATDEFEASDLQGFEDGRE